MDLQNLFQISLNCLFLFLILIIVLSPIIFIIKLFQFDWEGIGNIIKKALISLFLIPLTLLVQNISAPTELQPITYTTASTTDYTIPDNTESQPITYTTASTTDYTIPDNTEPTPLPHTPIRDGWFGSGCSCPYDLDKAGRYCGARSAYSRPGGSQPICYKDDQ